MDDPFYEVAFAVAAALVFHRFQTKFSGDCWIKAHQMLEDVNSFSSGSSLQISIKALTQGLMIYKKKLNIYEVDWQYYAQKNKYLTEEFKSLKPKLNGMLIKFGKEHEYHSQLQNNDQAELMRTLHSIATVLCPNSIIASTSKFEIPFMR